MRSRPLFAFVALLSLAPLGWLGAACAPPSSSAHAPEQVKPPTRADVDRVLDGFHDAAARSDEKAYFSCFAKDGVFLGTDATERWSVEAFRAYAHPHFAKQRGWVMRATKRNVSFASNDTALFDEELETKNLGPARGTGVLVREGGGFKVLQYNLTVTVPNDRFSSVKRLLAFPSDPPRTSPSVQALGFADPNRLAKVAALGPKLEALVDREMSQRHPPSLAVALVVDGKVAQIVVRGEADKKAHRKATRETLYRVGSITKTFTATALLALRDEGKLALDDRVDAHLPEFGRVALTPTDSRPITLRQLLSHTSGLPRLGDFDYTRLDRDVPESEVLAALDTRVVNPPGTEYLYSNFGFATAGLVVARAAGKPYREVLRERLFLPLGMTSATFEATRDGSSASGYANNDTDASRAPWRLGASEGAGGLYASLDDMAKWVGFQEQAWPARDGDDTGPVKRATLRESHLAQASSELSAERTREGLKVSAESVGLAWHVRRTCDYATLVEHGGAIDGFHAQITFAPDRGFGLVVLSNSITARTARIADDILELVASQKALEPREPIFAHEARVTKWLATYADTSPATYEAVFSKAFRDHVPLATMRDISAKLAARHGACKLTNDPKAPSTFVASRDEATLRATCERGALRVHAAADGQGLFVGFTVASTGFAPTQNVRRAANEALGLIAHWDDAHAKKLFAKEVKLPDLQAAFAAQRDDGGACTLGPGEGNGEDDARFLLRCERGRPLWLTVGLHKDAAVATLTLTPPEAPPTRCRATR